MTPSGHVAMLDHSVPVNRPSGLAECERRYLRLHYRVRCPTRGYWIRMSMHKLPGVAFTPKNARSTQSHWGELGASPDLGLEPGDLHHVRKLRSYVLCDGLPAHEVA